MSGYATDVRLGYRVARFVPDAATLFGWSIAFGICTISVYMLRGLFSFTEVTVGTLIGWVPGVGKWVNSKLEKAEQKLTHWVGSAAISSEVHMAAAFHGTAITVESIGHEIVGQSIAIWHLAQWTSHVAWHAALGNATTARYAKQLAADEAHLKALEKASLAHGQAISHADTGPIGAGVNKRTKAAAAAAGNIGAS